MEKPSAVCWMSMPTFFGMSWSALRTRQRAYRYMPATTTTMRIAPAANQRRSRETGRGISLQFTGPLRGKDDFPPRYAGDLSACGADESFLNRFPHGYRTLSRASICNQFPRLSATHLFLIA